MRWKCIRNFSQENIIWTPKWRLEDNTIMHLTGTRHTIQTTAQDSAVCYDLVKIVLNLQNAYTVGNLNQPGAYLLLKVKAAQE